MPAVSPRPRTRPAAQPRTKGAPGSHRARSPVTSTGPIPLAALLLTYATYGRDTVAAGVHRHLEQAYAVASAHLARPVAMIDSDIYTPIGDLAERFGYEKNRRAMLANLRRDADAPDDSDVITDAIVDFETTCKNAGFFLGLALAFELSAACRGGRE